MFTNNIVKFWTTRPWGGSSNLNKSVQQTVNHLSKKKSCYKSGKQGWSWSDVVLYSIWFISTLFVQNLVPIFREIQYMVKFFRWRQCRRQMVCWHLQWSVLESRTGHSFAKFPPFAKLVTSLKILMLFLFETESLLFNFFNIIIGRLICYKTSFYFNFLFTAPDKIIIFVDVVKHLSDFSIKIYMYLVAIVELLCQNELEPDENTQVF